MFTENNYPKHSSNHIIQPESVIKNRGDLVYPLVHPKWPEYDSEKAKTKTFQYILDSRDRNTSIYPDPNKYVLQLLDDFDNVTSIELIHAYIPSSGYTINESNCNLHLSVDNTEVIITLDHGIYQLTDSEETETYLLNEINDKLSESGYSYIKCAMSKVLNKFIFYNDYNSNATTPDIQFLFNNGKYNYDNSLAQTDDMYKKYTIGYNIFSF